MCHLVTVASSFLIVNEKRNLASTVFLQVGRQKSVQKGRNMKIILKLN